MLYLKLSIGLVILGESRSPFPRPSSTGNPHEQFPEHEVLASLLLSPKKLGIESTAVELRNSFSEFRLGGATMEEIATKLLLFFFSQKP